MIIETKYDLQEEVIVKALDVVGIVTEISVCNEKAIDYKVAYFCNGTRHVNWLEESELDGGASYK